MSYFDVPKRRIISTYILTIVIINFTLSFRLLPQPWRGQLDAGVVVGLIWGIISSVLLYLKAHLD